MAIITLLTYLFKFRWESKLYVRSDFRIERCGAFGNFPPITLVLHLKSDNGHLNGPIDSTDELLWFSPGTSKEQLAQSFAPRVQFYF